MPSSASQQRLGIYEKYPEVIEMTIMPSCAIGNKMISKISNAK